MFYGLMENNTVLAAQLGSSTQKREAAPLCNSENQENLMGLQVCCSA